MASPVLKGDNKQGILLCVSEGSPLRDCGPIFSDFRGARSGWDLTAPGILFEPRRVTCFLLWFLLPRVHEALPGRSSQNAFPHIFNFPEQVVQLFR
ncbi:hypothetical protein RHGRI_007913 [Rhododendron griersonianum]|uniref:Uncharacterized protein n=1 Tax=Rhododendron griersonianum TaxID=479676 RepID=A0AAV6L1M3_9ERIC|nr:hypothetical protein RHGRI_007913 [Rhododendron griersonianum]